MTTEQRDARIFKALAEHKVMMEDNHATPLLCIGIGHAPSRAAGAYVYSMVAGLSIEEAYRIISAMQEDLAIRLNVL